MTTNPQKPRAAWVETAIALHGLPDIGRRVFYRSSADSEPIGDPVALEVIEHVSDGGFKPIVAQVSPGSTLSYLHADQWVYAYCSDCGEPLEDFSVREGVCGCQPHDDNDAEAAEAIRPPTARELLDPAATVREYLDPAALVAWIRSNGDALIVERGEGAFGVHHEADVFDLLIDRVRRFHDVHGAAVDVFRYSRADADVTSPEARSPSDAFSD